VADLAWVQAFNEVEKYRLNYGITDRRTSLGAMSPSEVLDRISESVAASSDYDAIARSARLKRLVLDQVGRVVSDDGEDDRIAIVEKRHFAGQSPHRRRALAQGHGFDCDIARTDTLTGIGLDGEPRPGEKRCNRNRLVTVESDGGRRLLSAAVADRDIYAPAVLHDHDQVAITTDRHLVAMPDARENLLANPNVHPFLRRSSLTEHGAVSRLRAGDATIGRPFAASISCRPELDARSARDCLGRLGGGS
jgi:hypothetical protein